MNKVGTAYVLWLGGLLGVAGLHRIYNGKVLTGSLWLCTWGLFGVGQLADLILIPKMVESHNNRLSSRLTLAIEPKIEQVAQALQSDFPADRFFTIQPIGQSGQTAPPASQSVPADTLIQLLQAAELRGGKLSVTQGVMATGLSFAQVEAILRDMLKSGYVDVGNHPETGVVMYEFKEM